MCRIAAKHVHMLMHGSSIFMNLYLLLSVCLRSKLSFWAFYRHSLWPNNIVLVLKGQAEMNRTTLTSWDNSRKGQEHCKFSKNLTLKAAKLIERRRFWDHIWHTWVDQTWEKIQTFRRCLRKFLRIEEIFCHFTTFFTHYWVISCSNFTYFWK